MTDALDFERLFKLRLVVARQGEMDGARWWNTLGLLGPRGAAVLKRGFPATHLFTQARIVFTVARHRCNEWFNPPACLTLWNLPAAVEDQFEAHWQRWLDEEERWRPLFTALATSASGDLLQRLATFDLITPAQTRTVLKLRRSAENRAVPLSGTHPVNDETLTLLAAGFTRGDPGQPAIPYARRDDAAS